MNNIKSFEEFIDNKFNKKSNTNNTKDLKDLIQSFDINTIPMSILDKAYVDYEQFFDVVDVYSVDEDYIYEDNTNKNVEVKSVHDVVEYLDRMMKPSNCLFFIQNTNGIDFINSIIRLDKYPDFIAMEIVLIPSILMTPSVKENVDIITKEMDESGYFPSRKTIQRDSKGKVWLLMVFDPKKQESIREQVLKCHRYAYYTTPRYNADSIEKNGIIAKFSHKPYATNTKRVYLYIGNPDSEEYIEMMTDISNNLKRKDKNFTGDFVEYEISLNKLPKEMEFYIDVHGYGGDFIYTEMDIPVEAIRDSLDKSY